MNLIAHQTLTLVLQKIMVKTKINFRPFLYHRYLGKAVATPAMFCSYWQLNILKVVLSQTSKTVAHVTRCPQYLQLVANSSIRWIFFATVSQQFCFKVNLFFPVSFKFIHLILKTLFIPPAITLWLKEIARSPYWFENARVGVVSSNVRRVDRPLGENCNFSFLWDLKMRNTLPIIINPHIVRCESFVCT